MQNTEIHGLHTTSHSTYCCATHWWSQGQIHGWGCSIWSFCADMGRWEWVWQETLRKWAYSIRGMTPQDQRLLVRGTRYSAIPVVSLEGINDVCIIEGTVNGEKFEQFIRSCLIPILQPFDWINPHSVNQVDCSSFITHSVQLHGFIPLSCIHHITMQSSHKTQSQCRKPRSQSYWVHLSYLGYLLVLSCRRRFIMDSFSDLYSSSVRTPELSRFCSSLNCL